MISAVRGVLEYKGLDGVVVTVGGISLRIAVSLRTLDNLMEVGSEIFLYTHLHMREDLVSLYGFHDDEEKRLFEILITVSGIGPSLALSILSNRDPNSLVADITSENRDGLSRLSGVGRTRAGRLIELKSRLEKEWTTIDSASPVQFEGEVIEALMALGYSAIEARRAAVDSMKSSEAISLEENIRQALRRLGK